MNNNRINIIFIICKGHSGSTITNMLISSHPSVTGVGELINLNKYMKPDSGKYCTCEQDIYNCAIWSKVLKMAHLKPPLPLEEPENFDACNHNLLSAINEVNQTSWVCDISKSSKRLSLLTKSDRFNVTILHLVRDGRAVAYSYLRKKDRLNRKTFSSLKERLNFIKKYNYFRNINSWHKNNLHIYNKYKDYKNYHIIKYEDIVDDYTSVIKNIWSKIGLDSKEEYLENFDKDIHIIGGNRMRRNENIEVRKDLEYKNKIPAFNWLLSSIYLRKSRKLFGYKFSK